MRGLYQFVQLLIVVGGFYLLSGSCQSADNKPRFGDPLITADIRYLKSNGELTGTWSFFQRNQVDSLVPDARLHHFIINGQKVSSEKIKNNYHMYMVADTLVSQNLNVQIHPANRVISISTPTIPKMESERLQAGLDWTFTWDTSYYKTGDTISLVLSDSLSQTVLSNVAAQSGQLTIPFTRTRNLIPGNGYYYLISKAQRRKEDSDVDLEYSIEVYSKNFPVEIVSSVEN